MHFQGGHCSVCCILEGASSPDTEGEREIYIHTEKDITVIAGRCFLLINYIHDKLITVLNRHYFNELFLVKKFSGNVLKIVLSEKKRGGKNKLKSTSFIFFLPATVAVLTSSGAVFRGRSR